MDTPDYDIRWFLARSRMLRAANDLMDRPTQQQLAREFNWRLLRADLRTVRVHRAVVGALEQCVGQKGVWLYPALS